MKSALHCQRLPPRSRLSSLLDSGLHCQRKGGIDSVGSKPDNSMGPPRVHLVKKLWFFQVVFMDVKVGL